MLQWQMVYAAIETVWKNRCLYFFVRPTTVLVGPYRPVGLSFQWTQCGLGFTWRLFRLSPPRFLVKCSMVRGYRYRVIVLVYCVLFFLCSLLSFFSTFDALLYTPEPERYMFVKLSDCSFGDLWLSTSFWHDISMMIMYTVVVKGTI